MSKHHIEFPDGVASLPPHNDQFSVSSTKFELNLDNDLDKPAQTAKKKPCRVCGWCTWGWKYFGSGAIRVVRLLLSVAFVLADAAFAWGLYFSCASSLFPKAVAFGGAGLVLTLVEWVHAFRDSGPPHELKSVVRYFILCRSIVHDAPQLWVVGDFMLLEGPTTYYVTTYALALFGVLILGVLWRLLSLTEMGNFFPMRLCVGRRQRWCCGFVELLGIGVVCAFVVLAALILWPLGPWASDYPHATPSQLSGRIAVTVYTRTDSLAADGMCEHTIANYNPPVYPIGSEVSMDVKRHGFESSSRDPNPVSISIVSQFVSIQANISLDSDHKGTQVSLWRGGRTLFLCPGTAAPLGSSNCVSVNYAQPDSVSSDFGNVTAQSSEVVGKTLLASQVCVTIVEESTLEAAPLNTTETGTLQCQCSNGTTLGVTEVSFIVDTRTVCPGAKWWMY